MNISLEMRRELQCEDYLFVLRNAVEERMVMSNGQDERSQMHAMSLLLNTFDGMTNRVLIGDGARWILKGNTHDCCSGEGQGTTSGTTLTSTCSTNLDSVVCKRGSILANNGGLEQSAHANGNWCRDVNGVPAVTKLDTRKRSVDSAMRSAAIGHLRAMCRHREKSAGKSSPSTSSGKSSGKDGTVRGNTETSAVWTSRSSPT